MPDIPGMPSVTNVKTRSSLITWNAADDYLESRLKRYIIQVSNGGGMMTINVTSGIDGKKVSYNLQNMTEYTFYNLSIAAESAIGRSSFTKEKKFLTLCEYINLLVNIQIWE